MKKSEYKRICITYPPFVNNANIASMNINSQFSWIDEKYYIYPLLPASAATLLKHYHYNVMFLDTVIKRLNAVEWFDILESFSPDIIFLEVRTPTINYTWDTIDILKDKLPNTIIVIGGDHVTSLPEESFENSKVDFIITGGDYDVLLLSIANHLNNRELKLEKGILYRNTKGNIKNTGKCLLNYDLDKIPFIDRDLTNWKLYSNNNIIFRKKPATFIMSGRGGIDSNYNSVASNILFPNARFRSPSNVVSEIFYLYKRYRIKEFFDITNSFPEEDWLLEFYSSMKEKKLNNKVYIDCYSNLKKHSSNYYQLLKKCGVKTLLFNLPSGSNRTLDFFNVCNSIDGIIQNIKYAKMYGLIVYLNIHIGYPFETAEDIISTFTVLKDIMIKGYVSFIDVSLFVPYPNTKLFNYCKENNLLATENWFDYDMRRSVMKLNISDEDLFQYMNYFYNLSFNPSYLFHKIIRIKNIYDLKFYFNSVKNLIAKQIKS